MPAGSDPPGSLTVIGNPFAPWAAQFFRAWWGHMPEESFEEQASLRGVHVVLVVDDPEPRELMQTVLEYAAALVSPNQHVLKPVDPWELCRLVASLVRRA